MTDRNSRRRFLGHVIAVATGSLAFRGWGRAAVPAEAPSLRRAMDRAAGCCLAWLNPEQGSLPTGGYEVAHDTGRWWDAMLRYEAATGVRIPA